MPRAATVPIVSPARPPGCAGASQRGAALVLALVLLIATSALAVSTLSGTRLSETMASNAHWKATAFEVAESGIEAALADTGALFDALDDVAGNDAPARTLSLSGTDLDADYGQTLGTGATLEHDGELKVQYCGETPSRTGSGLNADLDVGGGTVSHLLDVRSTVTTTGSAARAEHVQRVSLPGPSVGYGAACAAP